MKLFLLFALLCMYCYIILFIASFASSQITCVTGETYLKMVEHLPSGTDQIDFEILSGDTVLFTRSAESSSSPPSIEKCLTSSTNNQYTIKLLSISGNSWPAGSYLTIFGKNNNAVFKTTLTASNEESYVLSLYYGIDQGAAWKMTSGSFTAAWTDYSFSDSSWSDVTLGSDSIPPASGTQYFRKQFTGLSDMAAYDVRLYYKAGVIAYINGVEVYRDNMSEGDVTSASTPFPTGEYSELAYRGFIRPGFEVASPQSILAVEIHFLTPQTSVDFNAYLAILASSVANNDCFIYPETVTIDSAGIGVDVMNSFDFSMTSQYTVSASYLPATLTYSFEGPKPFINSLRLYPSSSLNNAPSSFTWQGSDNNQDWTDVISVSDAQYESNVYRVFNGYFYGTLYNNYRLNLVSTVNSPMMRVYEMQPLICAYSPPTSISFTPNSYTVWAKYEDIVIKPDINEFTSCSAENLPSGLTIDSDSCVISGIVSERGLPESSVTVKVSSLILGTTYTGSFTLTVNECSGTLVNVLRTYGAQGAQNEYFTIKDSSSGDVVLSVNANDGQQNGETKSYYLCLTANKYEVTIGANGQFWYVSFVYIRTVLSTNEMETILRMRYDNYMHLATTRTFNPLYSIPSHSDWYYYTGQTIPNNWYNTNLDMNTDWSETNVDSLPSTIPTNHIQLYRKSFTISDVISNIGGFVISIKYKYGCIIYINGNEVFRKGLSDTLISESSTSSNTYDEVIYRQISLPIQIVKNKGDSTVSEYIKFGSNTIAIG